MSIGAVYIAIEELEMNECLLKKSSIFELSNNKNKFSVEQYWDAIRILFIDTIPNILGEELIDFSDMGEQTLKIDNNEIKKINSVLKKFEEKDLKNLINSDSFKQEDFYWKETLLEEPEDLIDIVLELKQFFYDIEKMEKNHIVLVSLG